jgi:hypothetical protein
MKLASPTPEVAEKPVKKRWWLALFGGGTFWISVFLHVFFAAVATYVVVEHFTKKHIDFHATEPPAPHTEVEHKVEMAKKNNVDSAPPDLKRITTTDISPISLPDVPETPKVSDATPSPMAGEGDLGEGMGSGNGTGGNGGGSPEFGVADGTGLQGYFYDLKQTPGGEPTAKSADFYNKFYDILKDYMKRGWNDAILDHYFKSDAPLYASSFAIPIRPSSDAPKAFQLENKVKPSFWAIHYHGKVMAPESADYQFVGFGDNILVVKIGGEVVLDAGWSPLFPTRANLHKTLPFQWTEQYSKDHRYPATYGLLKSGPKFHMDAMAPVDMDVLIGDDGGVCGFFLMVMKAGNKYETMPDGTPKAPFFQLNNEGPPDFSSGDVHPPFSPLPEPWQLAPN